MKKFISMLLVALIFCIGTTIAEEVTIDIKPDTVYNTINLDSNGLLPVAILGTEDFNVMTDIDISTLTFGIDETNSIEPNRIISYTDTNGDEILDLIMKFEIEKLAFLSDFILSNECVDLSVFGKKFNGDVFSGVDCVYNPKIPEPITPVL